MSRLADDRTERLLHALAADMPRERLTEGYELFRAGRVYETEIAGETVYGAVDDEAVRAVTLDAWDMAYSACTCRAPAPCAHMAAVFFQYCETEGGEAAAVFEAMTSPGGLDRRKPGQPGIGDGPESWAAWFDERYGQVWEQCRHALHPLQRVLQEAKGSVRDWPPRKKRLHWLQTVLLVLEQAERAYAATDPYNRYYYEVSFSRAVEPWTAHWLELLREAPAVPAEGDEQRWLRAVALRLREAALNDSYALLRWDELYLAWWGHFAAWREAVLDEREVMDRLAAGLAGAGAGSGSGDGAGGHRSAEQPAAFRSAWAIWAAQAHFRFQDGDHDGAIAALARTPFERTARQACGYAERCLAAGGFGALERWMQFMQGQLRASRSAAHLRPFLRLCRAADERQPDNPLWIRLMREHLPRGYPELSAHYLARGRYKEWADLQLAMGVQPEELDPVHLRDAAKHAPHLLLPLYHQAIEEAVRSRARPGYRTAARLLKRLEKLYRASGRDEVWHRFITEFRNRHARLRALQEELRYASLTDRQRQL